MSDEIKDVKNEIELDLMTLDTKLQRLVDAVDVVKDRQEQMALDIGKIKEAVYNPDSGLYARLRSLEAWKDTSSRITWILVTSLVGLASATFWNLIVSQ
tara:strand:- start:92 stop:388 length:297 start_codon:yes stop_codon:yes gene_type:complete